MARFRPEERVKHWLGNTRVWVNGDRGVAEVDTIVMMRGYIGGYLFDVSSRARFYDLVEKQDGTWKISQWRMIYDADRMDAVEPGKVPQAFYDEIALSPFPNACAYLCLRITSAAHHWH